VCAEAVIIVPVAESVMSENRVTVVVAAGIPFFYPSIRSPEWRSPCGLFESVRAAPSACESRSAIFAPEGARIGGLSQVALERALTTRVRVIASVGGSRS